MDIDFFLQLVALVLAGIFGGAVASALQARHTNNAFVRWARYQTGQEANRQNLIGSLSTEINLLWRHYHYHYGERIDAASAWEHLDLLIPPRGHSAPVFDHLLGRLCATDVVDEDILRFHFGIQAVLDDITTMVELKDRHQLLMDQITSVSYGPKEELLQKELRLVEDKLVALFDRVQEIHQVLSEIISALSSR